MRGLIPLRYRRLHPGATAPRYAKSGDAGADLATVEEVTLAPGERALVPTGIALEIPPGWVGLVHPRSGLAARHGLTIVNAPGTIDSGYRGEILVNLVNLDPREPITLRPGDRIAQLVLQEVGQADFVEVDSLPASERGETGHGSSGGFGSSGTPPSTHHRRTTPRGEA
ncbi:dUTP diphosphatase [Janibacter sp. GXQ6167]|uniref:dUTP diphosphatase n=1 Tax=Janibacter sp. GXQ6167 TaxID=3240791 RepID=UPI0035262127